MLRLGLECCDSFLWVYESLGFGSKLETLGVGSFSPKVRF